MGLAQVSWRRNLYVETIGAADDHSTANGVETLDFFQAQRSAREVAALAKAPESPRGPFTVAAAMDSYFARLEHEGSKSLPMRAAGRGCISSRCLETCRSRT